MTILILQGPNLNLLGKKSAEIGESITLNKLNRAIRLHVRNTKIKLKIRKTSINLVINFIKKKWL